MSQNLTPSIFFDDDDDDDQVNKDEVEKKTGAECPNYLSRAHLCASRDHSDPGDHGKTGQWGKVSKGPDFPASRSLAGWLGAW